MARDARTPRGEVKWYVPSLIALALGIVAVMVVWLLMPPTRTVDVPVFDPNDFRKDISLRLEQDATRYVISGMKDMKAAVRVVDGKTVYDPVEVRGEVVSIFRDVEYNATFTGVWQLKESPEGGTVQTVRGVASGQVVVPWETTARPSAKDDLQTRCRILDEFPRGRFLVEGVVTLIDRPLLVGPHAVITNALKEKRDIVLTDCFGHTHRLLPGAEVKLDSAGEFIEEDLPASAGKP